MRAGLTVVGICLVLSVVIAWQLKGRYKDELLSVQDLATGLIYYIEEHGGEFPPSEAEFLASDFIEHLPDGPVRIAGRPDSDYRRETYGYPIRDLPRFKVAWGARFEEMSLNERGRGVDGTGRVVQLVAWPSSGSSGREFSMLLYEVSQRARKKAATGSGE